jgi:hypothetical protein
MKLLNKIFYIGVFGIAIPAAIRFPYWVQGGLFDESPIAGIGVATAIYGALIGGVVMFIKEL